MTMALEGIRVLDFSRQMAAPYGTMLLADYGADVIKVESLPKGDGSRSTGTDFVDGESAIFLQWNRGKRSVALDMRKPEALEIIRRLVVDCDVLVENYRPGVADEIGIGYEAMSALNPRLVYTSVSAFGPTGPLAPYPGTDPVVQAVSGVMSVTGEPGGDPLLVGVPIADFTGAMLCAQAVMLGLLARERTGKGQKIDVSMLFGLMSALTTRLATHWATDEDPGRFGSAHSIVVPYQSFRTKDGHAVAGVWGGNGWPKFCAAIGRPDLVENERYRTNIDRVNRRDEVTALLQEVFLTRTTAEWEQSFNEQGALFGPVQTFSEVFAHPQVQQAGLVKMIDHPKLGPIKQLAPVIFMSDTPGEIRSAPPLLGEHTDEVLRQAGYSEADIEAMKAGGVALAAEVLTAPH
ncbi:MAG TPA: CoA transferase [Candidatus Dormibacteraeota bacterium]|jgi:formyl-CoA transferase/CoA:oxalate CoA-transferase|nr:CoA transferase [Candidatus Dormibacteraeota bacterium]